MEAGALQAPAGLSRISISTPLLRLRSDEQLVALFRSGNEDAFQVIFDRYRQRLFAYTRQMLSGSRQDAEDALQDVFLRAYAALRANDRPVSLRAWLYRVAHNRCIDQLRRPTPAHSDVFEMSRGPLRDPLQETERREDLRRLVEDVSRLPEAQRSALLMREIDGLSYQELADALDVTVPAIKSLLVRARIGLVEAIEARDTACVDIRTDLLTSFDKGVRSTGKARRHLRDCAGCRAYRTELRTVRRGFGALSPGHGPLSLLAKALGIGGAGGGAAAGGGAVVLGGGGAAAVGGGAAAATACKVAAVVCSAAFVTGAAGTVEQAVKRAVKPAPVAAATVASEPSQAARALTQPIDLQQPIAAAAPAASAAAPAAETASEMRRRARDRAAPSAAVAGGDEPITPDGAVYGDPDPRLAALPAQEPAAATETGGAIAPEEVTASPDAPPPNVASGAAPPATTGTTAPGVATSAPRTGTATGPATTTTAGSGATGPGTASGTGTVTPAAGRDPGGATAPAGKGTVTSTTTSALTAGAQPSATAAGAASSTPGSAP